MSTSYVTKYTYAYFRCRIAGQVCSLQHGSAFTAARHTPSSLARNTSYCESATSIPFRTAIALPYNVHVTRIFRGMSTIQNVAILGADGNLGPSILNALAAAPFTVTVIKRATSTSPDNAYPSGVKVSRVPDDLPLDALTAALAGQDALIVTIKATQSDVQKRLADAAVQAGVKRFMPADFGSCDSSTQQAQDLVPLFKHKAELRAHVQDLAKKHPAFSWTSLVTGHFFDWSLPFIHVDLPGRKADVLGDGDSVCSMSTLSRIGEATVRVLQRPAETANQMLFVQSFCVTQNAVVSAFEKATGGGAWEVEKFPADQFREDMRARAANGDKEAVEHLVYYLGVVDGDWRKKDGFAMDMLGLKDEDVEAVVRDVVRKSS